ERVADLGAIGRHLSQMAGQHLHGVERQIARHPRRGERPHVAERHRPEAPGAPAIPRRDPAPYVEQRDAIDGAPAELVGRPVAVVHEAVPDVRDADVCRSRCRGRHRYKADTKTFSSSTAIIRGVTGSSVWQKATMMTRSPAAKCRAAAPLTTTWRPPSGSSMA